MNRMNQNGNQYVLDGMTRSVVTVNAKSCTNCSKINILYFSKICQMQAGCPLSFETGGTMGYHCCFFLNFVPLHIESPYNFGGKKPSVEGKWACWQGYDKIKNKKYHTVGTFPKSTGIRKIIETETKSILLTQIYITAHFPGTSITDGGVKVVLWAHFYPGCEIVRSC
jgi:hypothetical protein